MEKKIYKIISIITIFILLLNINFLFNQQVVKALSYNGEDLAYAILANQSTLISSSYTDNDKEGTRQSIILSSLGNMLPTHGPTFALFSTGIAGQNPVTKNGLIPGDERGTSFKNDHGHPRDEVTLTMNLQVPLYMHYIYYDVQFFTSEYPEFIGTQYNDRLTITIDSPSKGISDYMIDVNSGYFVLDSHDLTGTGFDIYAQSGIPEEVDWIDTTPRTPGADAGASNLIPIGGAFHPVSPNEIITVTINLIDVGDNCFDSAAFIDNMVFSGYAKTEIISRKTAQDLNGNNLECNDVIRYNVMISNIGAADQLDNPGYEFEDFLPDNTTYVTGSVVSTSGTIEYKNNGNRIIWNGSVPAESSVQLTYEVIVNSSLINGALISNQGTVFWDSNENGTNDKIELTDDPHVDDGLDQDGDGNTNDEDPTCLYVYSFEPPVQVTEDFSDDSSGEKAVQIYFDREWFKTDNVTETAKSIFNVVSNYHYLTDKSFKTKLRAITGTHKWKYMLNAIESDIIWWEIWFRCGNASEKYDLYLDFKNNVGNDIAKIKFEYVYKGTTCIPDWVIEMYYWNPGIGWKRLNSDFSGGYLYNSWYKLRIEKIESSSIGYSLNRTGKGLVDYKTGNSFSASFSDLTIIEWSSTKNPVLCPIFFWDEHRIGLINE